MNPTLQSRRPRRHVLGAAATALLLVACGGGADPGGPGGGSGPVGGTPGEQPSHQPAPAPQIARFEASTTQVFVGDAATLRGEFSGGSGRIDPTLGAVVSGTEVSTGPLDRDTSFRLVVSAPGAQEVERALTVRVGYRDEYVNLPLAFASAQHAAVLAGDGTVLLIGGSRGDGGPSKDIDRFDLNTNNIRPAGQLLAARVGPVATRLTDGQVLVTGGSIEPQQASSAELVNERTGQSSFAGRMSVARTDHAAVSLGGGRVLVTGGVTSGEGAPNTISASAEIWEPATRSFRRLSAPMHTPRSSHTMTSLGDGRILIVGGYSSAAGARLGEIFDPTTETFTPVPGVWPLRANHVALNTPDGHVLVLGGDAPQAGSGDLVATASVLRYDRVDNLFRELPPLAAPRTDVRAAMLPSGQVLLFGGLQSGQASASAERYDPAQGGTPIRSLDSARHGHSVSRLNNGRVVLIGGEGAGGGFAAGLRIYR